MARFALALIMGLTFATACPVARARELPLAIARDIDSVFDRWDSTHSPGGAIAIVHRGEVVFSRGFGVADLDHRVPFTPATVSNIASVSKQFTAMAVRLLERDGALAVSHSVRRYIPELPEYASDITLEHLLHHTSGLRDYTMLLQIAGVRFYQDYVDQDAILRLIVSQQSGAFAPGERFEYSNTNYLLLAHIIERVSGASFADFVARRIFQPLGMTDSRVQRSINEVIPGRARAYRPSSASTFRISEDSFESLGDGGVFTTAADLALWLRNFSTHEIGGALVMEQMMTPGATRDGDNTGYAGGLEIGSHRDWTLVSHSGGTAGYRARIAWVKELDLGVALLANVSTVRASREVSAVLDILVDGFIAPTETTASTATPHAAVPAPAAKSNSEAGAQWAGIYHRIDGWILRFFVNGARFLGEVNGGTAFELVQVDSGRFVIADSPDESFTFTQAEQGRRACSYQFGDTIRMHSEVEPLRPDEAQPYLGEYHSAELGVSYDVVHEHGQLQVRVRGFGQRTIYASLVRIAGERFTGGSVDTIEFERADDGRITALFITIDRMGQMRFDRMSAP